MEVTEERQRLQAAVPLIDQQLQKVRKLVSAAYTRARAENPEEWQRRQQEHWDKGAAWLETQMTALAAQDTQWQRGAQ